MKPFTTKRAVILYYFLFISDNHIQARPMDKYSKRRTRIEYQSLSKNSYSESILIAVAPSAYFAPSTYSMRILLRNFSVMHPKIIALGVSSSKRIHKNTRTVSAIRNCYRLNLLTAENLLDAPGLALMYIFQGSPVFCSKDKKILYNIQLVLSDYEKLMHHTWSLGMSCYLVITVV